MGNLGGFFWIFKFGVFWAEFGLEALIYQESTVLWLGGGFVRKKGKFRRLFKFKTFFKFLVCACVW